MEGLDSNSVGGLLDGMSTSALFASFFWGTAATGFLIYGWKQKALIPFFVGVALTAASFLMLSSALYMSLVCIAILAVFVWMKKQGY